MKKIDLICYDFDGVMTDNIAYIDENGREMVKINRSDGLGVSEIKQLGLKQIIISTEKNPVVGQRSKKLGLTCLQGISDKSDALKEYCKKNNINLDEVAYVGNDINDLEAMKLAGVTFCPADAHSSVKNISDHILSSKGGEGVVREIFDHLIKN